MPGPATPILVILLVLLYSCTGKDKAEEEIKLLEESLSNSNGLINLSTQIHLRELEERTTDPLTMDRAITWFAKASHISTLSKTIYNYIDSIKKAKKTDRSIDLINEKVSVYKQAILKTDSSIQNEFQTIIDQSIKKTDKKSAASLTMIQNDIKVLENKLILYCNTKTTGVILNCDFPKLIIGQNSNYINPGSELVIIAGIGTFTSMAEQAITINGQVIQTNEEAQSIYKIKTSKEPGKYKVPVKASFMNRVTGKKEIQEVTVEYTVAKPCDQ